VTTKATSPHLYLDTNVFLDAIDRRKPASIDLVNRIAAEGWECSTSRFTFLEMLDVKQDNQFVQNRLDEGMQPSWIVRHLRDRRWGTLALRRRELDAIYGELYEAIEKDFRFVTFQRPRPELWDEAEEFCAATNVGAADAIHLATAVAAECDILVTNDKDFRKIAEPYILAAPPARAIEALQELGFDIE